MQDKVYKNNGRNNTTNFQKEELPFISQPTNLNQLSHFNEDAILGDVEITSTALIFK